MLFGLQVFIAAAFVPSEGSVRLHSTEFRWFNSNPPGPVTAGPTAWVLPVPGQAGTDGRIAVNDAVSLSSFDLGQLSFTAAFVNGTLLQGQPTEFADELVVFAASDVATYHGFEFGIRLSLVDGFVYAYWQYPTGGGAVAFHEQRLFSNDGRPHSYDLSLTGTAISYRVDGRTMLAVLYPIAPPSSFYVVTTAHRGSAGWSATGLELSVSDITVRQPFY
jgi:hypothetical protein